MGVDAKQLVRLVKQKKTITSKQKFI